MHVVKIEKVGQSVRFVMDKSDHIGPPLGVVNLPGSSPPSPSYDETFYPNPLWYTSLGRHWWWWTEYQ